MIRERHKPYLQLKAAACLLVLTVAWTALPAMGQVPHPAEPGPRELILMIGDGMGFEQVHAASLYAHGREGALFLESLPVRGSMTTYSIDPECPGKRAVTDSAAAATAMATGYKVVNGVISKKIPGDGGDLETLLEKYAKAGRRTGLVTTAYITHATPAGFGAHAENRKELAVIAEAYLYASRPNVLYGGGCKYLPAEAAERAGYLVVVDRRRLEALDTRLTRHVLGRFGLGHMPYDLAREPTTQPATTSSAPSAGGGRPNPAYSAADAPPHLTEMTRSALAVLAAGGEGFFLMVEGGRIDHACHKHDLPRCIGETLEFDRAVRAVIDWAKGREDVLVIVTADHETGGLKVLKSNGKGRWPDVLWQRTGHTSQAVPIYAWGQGAELFDGQMDNTDLPARIAQAAALCPVALP